MLQIFNKAVFDIKVHKRRKIPSSLKISCIKNQYEQTKSDIHIFQHQSENSKVKICSLFGLNVFFNV